MGCLWTSWFHWALSKFIKDSLKIYFSPLRVHSSPIIQWAFNEDNFASPTFSDNRHSVTHFHEFCQLWTSIFQKPFTWFERLLQYTPPLCDHYHYPPSKYRNLISAQSWRWILMALPAWIPHVSPHVRINWIIDCHTSLTWAVPGLVAGDQAPGPAPGWPGQLILVTGITGNME